MAAYFAKHAWGNTTLQDLIDELAAASGRDLDGWRTAGWRRPAPTCSGSSSRGRCVRARGHPPTRGAPRPHALGVGAYRRTRRPGADRVRRASRSPGSAPPVDLPPGADLYLVNDDDLTFATRPDTGSRDALFELAAELPTAISRGVAVATVWDMLITGEARTAEVVQRSRGVLRAETADPCLEPYLGLALAGVEPLVACRGARRPLGPRGRRLSRAGRDTGPSPGRAAGLAGTAGLEDVTRLLAAGRGRHRPAVAAARRWPSSADVDEDQVRRSGRSRPRPRVVGARPRRTRRQPRPPRTRRPSGRR